MKLPTFYECLGAVNLVWSLVFMAAGNLDLAVWFLGSVILFAVYEVDEKITKLLRATPNTQTTASRRG